MAEPPTGIALDRDLDLKLDNVGDIQTETGASDIRKNLGYLTKRVLDRVPGRVITEALVGDVEVGVKNVLETYSRVEEVRSVDVTVPEGARTVEELDVTVLVVVDETQLLVEPPA
jgi:hypothetical protein